jgi:hypothetical protein
MNIFDARKYVGVSRRIRGFGQFWEEFGDDSFGDDSFGGGFSEGGGSNAVDIKSNECDTPEVINRLFSRFFSKSLSTSSSISSVTASSTTSSSIV